MSATDTKTDFDGANAPLKILICSSEMEPFAQTGGLGDVTAGLSKRLAEAGHDVRVFIPRYKSVYQTGIKAKPGAEQLSIAVNGTSLPARWETYHDKTTGVEIVFVVNDHLFHRDHLYTDSDSGMDFSDNDERFIFFSRAVLEICKTRDWAPDIVHANDWQTGLTSVYLKRLYQDDSFFAKTRSVLTIHNAAYQGVFSKEAFERLGLKDVGDGDLARFHKGGKLNLLKAAIHHADTLTTVSERYAMEIQSASECGRGLERDLRERNADLHGVLSGVDYDKWDPANDPHIPHSFDSHHLVGKRGNKTALQRKLGFEDEGNRPFLGMISRLTEQKGIELFLEIADDVLARDVQMVVLGDGERKYADALRDVERRHKGKFKALIGFDNKMAHLIEAGVDMALMPSLYEPCGMTQMYSLRYGSAPIVRETGGLADTISEYNPSTNEGAGFVFKSFSSDEFDAAILRALALYEDRDHWQTLMKNCMERDFSWRSAIVRYVEIYRQTLSKTDRSSHSVDKTVAA
jgi:starch synthase